MLSERGHLLTAGILIFLGRLLPPYAALFYSLVIATLMMSGPYRAHVWISVSATLWSVAWIRWQWCASTRR